MMEDIDLTMLARSAYDINCDTCATTDITASGAVPEVGITCAADWDILPAGTVIYISGVGIRVVQDCGGLVQGKTKIHK